MNGTLAEALDYLARPDGALRDDLDGLDQVARGLQAAIRMERDRGAILAFAEASAVLSALLRRGAEVGADQEAPARFEQAIAIAVNARTAVQEEVLRVGFSDMNTAAYTRLAHEGGLAALRWAEREAGPRKPELLGQALDLLERAVGGYEQLDRLPERQAAFEQYWRARELLGGIAPEGSQPGPDEPREG
ncbi:hypothetical protein [Propylenella binzhouense]|uniref:Uncharacterized protein n=1 Tax=Propylenella binzhouense TaxID=2555902 RepID=A0A964WU72_9HYPH|nr:hypothetical protein [Propylenella binzhouense]MYZ48802.1 hypothetical protein [Propylenella binzhouense]